MAIKVAESELDLKHCYPVMVQLRPHLSIEVFIDQVNRQSQQDGYRLVFLEDNGIVKAVAGCRITEMLSHGRFLYVDDLVTDAGSRSKGYGDTLFDWLVDYAQKHHCDHLQLDSGVQRTQAHRFYFRKRMHISAYHFTLKLD